MVLDVTVSEVTTDLRVGGSNPSGRVKFNYLRDSKGSRKKTGRQLVAKEREGAAIGSLG